MSYRSPRLLMALSGLVLMAYGLASVLDLISLRQVLATLELGRPLLVTQRLHALIGHPVAQLVELLIGLWGLTLLAGAAWLAVRRGSSPEPA